MPYAVDYLADAGIVQASFRGSLTPVELAAAFEEIVSLAQQHGVLRILSDCSTLQGGHSTFDLFDLVERMPGIASGRRLREAVILPSLEAPAANVAFWETACRNRGFDVRCFSTRGAALAWLCDGSG